MDPSTGTFISMDTFPANVYDPVTLHRYLYANANPVLYTDPTGYFSLAEFSVSSAISDTLSSMNVHLTLKGMMEAANFICTAYDVVNSFMGVLSGDGNFGQLFMSLAQGVTVGWMMNCICTTKLAFFIKPVFATFGIIGQYNQIVEAAKSGDPLEFTIRVIQMTTMIYSLTRQCFTAGTPVLTEDGLRPIEEIKPGDYVLACDTTTGEQSLQKVLRVFVSTTDTIVTITTSDKEVIETTEGHPFYVTDEGWVPAGNLKSGDILRTSDGREVRVESVVIEKRDEPVTVYNLEIEHEHTYYVAEGKVLVHNEQQCGTGGKSDGDSGSGTGDESGTSTKPNQEHHYATNKSKTYTPQLEEIANRYELDLDDAWNKDLLPHQGRHPNAYHEYVLESMKQFDII